MSRPHVVAAADLVELRDLELVARRIVEGVRQGMHRSPLHGFAAEFSQYRHYRPGDDLRYVDWKAFARTDRLYSRQFHETTNLAALFVIDGSLSMAYPPEGQSKHDLARAAAAALATLVIDQGDAAGLAPLVDAEGKGRATSRPAERRTAGGTPGRYVAPRTGRHHLRLLLGELARRHCGEDAALSPALRRAGLLLRRRSMVIALSDFYEADAPAELRRLARMGHEIVAVQVMAREELELPRGESAEFEDLESGETRLTVTSRVAARYRANLRGFLEQTRRAMQREGMDYVQLTTGEPLDRALRRFLLERRAGL